MLVAAWQIRRRKSLLDALQRTEVVYLRLGDGGTQQLRYSVCVYGGPPLWAATPVECLHSDVQGIPSIFFNLTGYPESDLTITVCTSHHVEQHACFKFVWLNKFTAAGSRAA